MFHILKFPIFQLISFLNHPVQNSPIRLAHYVKAQPKFIPLQLGLIWQKNRSSSLKLKIITENKLSTRKLLLLEKNIILNGGKNTIDSNELTEFTK